MQGRTYTIESKIDSFAKKEAVLDVLTDYPNHSEIFSSISSSQVIARRDHEAEVLQVKPMLLCTWVFSVCWGMFVGLDHN